MKNKIPLLIASLILVMVSAINLVAQDITEVTIMVKKDGKVVKDTTYQFDNEDEAKLALEMMELLGGEVNHSKSMVFISEDGKSTEIKELGGDSLVWVSEGNHEDIHTHGENVIIMKSDEGVDKKHVKVVVVGDEEGATWSVKEGEKEEGDHNVYVITSNGNKDKTEVEVEVKVTEKSEKEDKK